VARIHQNTNTGKQAGGNCIMMDEVIVRMKYVGAIDAQLPGDS
jgi:hypothetical protein